MATKRLFDEELRQFKELEGLLNPKLPIPTDADIDRCIEKIEGRLAEKAIYWRCNLSVREGYQMSIELLRNRTNDFTESFIGDMETVQGRAIAMMAIDYLNGSCSEETLCGVPIRGGRKQQAGL